MHRGIRQTASLYLYSLIVTISWLFSTRVSHQPYHPIYQTSSNRIMCWIHQFHQYIQVLTLTYAKITLTFYNHCPVFITPPFVPQNSICQVDKKCGQGHLVLIYINNKLECSGFEKKGEIVNNDIWIC